MASAAEQINKAMFFLQQGKIGDAEVILKSILRVHPNNFDALQFSGIICAQRASYVEAEKYLRKALSIDPNVAPCVFNYAGVLCKLGRFQDAIDIYSKAAALAPNYAPIYSDRGNALYELQRYAEAIASYDKAIEQSSGFADAWVGRGNAALQLKRYDEAIEAFQKALNLQPNLANAWLGRGNVFVYLKRYEEALAAYDKAIALNPTLAAAWSGRGNVLAELMRFSDAIAAYDKATALKPDLAEAWLARGNILYEYNYNDRAIADYKKAISVRSDFIEARFAECFAELPVLYLDEKEILLCRAAYTKKLRALHDEIKAGVVQGELAKAFASYAPFYLAYQGYNDRELQRMYGSLACHIMESEYSKIPFTPKAKPGEKIKVGFVSSFFFMHSNWKTPLKGWISQLDRTRFDVFGYHVGKFRDKETDVAAAMCNRFVHRALTVDGWRNEILNDAPHVLIYPGLFMDSVTTQLVSQRLAPVQCNSWGHPETSGMRTVDYFLSSALMEPPGSTDHYTEELICLPNLSIYYEPLETKLSVVTRAEMGIRSDAVVFCCAQSLHKYLPQFDRVFAQIAKSVKNSQFVFFKHYKAERISTLFQERLSKAFASQGLNASDHFLFLPRLDHSRFIAAMGQSDIILDSIDWSGCNSTLDSLSHNLPIVTMRGTLMRGLHTSAILSMMDVAETVTKNIDEYIATAIRLAQDPDARATLSRKISANKHRVYRDRECIAALEEFLDRVGHQQSS